MSIQIIEIKHPLNDKNNFHSRIIEYSDFGSYKDDLQRQTADIRIFKTHLNRLNMYYEHIDGDIVVHEAWIVTET